MKPIGLMNTICRMPLTLDLIGNILESSTEYSVVGKDLERKIPLWDEGARRLHGYEHGLTLTRQLKANPTYQHIRNLALASFPITDGNEKAVAAGCHGYISKPMS